LQGENKGREKVSTGRKGVNTKSESLVAEEEQKKMEGEEGAGRTPFPLPLLKAKGSNEALAPMRWAAGETKHQQGERVNRE
jgi:hypothetical protein